MATTKPLLALISFVALSNAVFAAPPSDPMDFGESLGQGIDVTTDDGQNITMPNGETLDSEEFQGDAENPDQETMVEEAKNNSGDAEALQEMERQASQDLAGTGTYDNHQSRAFDTTLNSVATDSGEREIDSYGCTIRRASHNDMTYVPSNSVGNQIVGDNITIDQDTCQPSYTDRFGATCQIVGSQTTCAVADNTRKVRSASTVEVKTEVDFQPLVRQRGFQNRGALQYWYRNNRWGYTDHMVWTINVDVSNFISPNQAVIKVYHADEVVLPGSTTCSSPTDCVTSINVSTGQYGPEDVNSNTHVIQRGLEVETYRGYDISDSLSQQGVVTLRGHLIDQHHDIKRVQDRTPLQVYRLEVDYNGGFTNNAGNLPYCGENYELVNFGELCEYYEEITVTPSVAQSELSPLFGADSQSPVCWEAGTESVCTVDTATTDPLAEQIANDSFDQDVIDQSLLNMFGDCTEQEVTETVSSTVDYTDQEYCERPISPTISGCTLNRSVSLDGSLQITEDKWSGSQRCELIESRLDAYGSECTYSTNYSTPDCITANNGVEICSPSHISGQGVDVSVCGAGSVNVNASMASSVDFLSNTDVGMCVDTATDDCTDTTANGDSVCVKDGTLSMPSKTSVAYSDLGNGISKGGPTSPSLTISDIECDPPSDSGCDTLTDANGDSFTVCGGFDSTNECSGVLSQDGCTVSSTRCIEETGHGLVCESEGDCFDQLCFREEVTVDCDQSESYDDQVTRTEVSCPDTDYHCIDGSCFNQDTDTNSDFGRAAAMLSAAEGIGTHMKCEDETDPSTCSIFGGEYYSCRRATGPGASLFNCCDISGGSGTLHKEDYIAAVLGAGAAYAGWAAGEDITAVVGATATMVNAAKAVISFIVPCYPEEYEIAMGKETDSLIYLGKNCGKSISVGFSTICTRRDTHYCKFDSPLGRILMEQAALQLEDNNGDLWRDYSNPQKDQSFCEGMTLDQIASLDWDQIDLGEWEYMMRESNNMPPAECGTMDLDNGGCSNVDQRDYDVDPNTQSPTDNPGNVSPL